VRRRGTAIVVNKEGIQKGILVAAMRNKLFLLPGGGANKDESRRRAAIRELYEETGLRATSIKFLFNIKTSMDHKVFLIRAKGHPRPRMEIKHIRWWTPESKFRISHGTKRIIEKFLSTTNNNDSH
jgi:8-oxo-dGTP pyrophosphatase MutT (NUDIX family)